MEVGGFSGNVTFLLGTLLPLLTEDVTYGGLPPYVMFVNDPKGT